MKKYLLVICMMLFSVASFAQQGRTAVGVHGNYLLKSPNNFGLGANVSYEFIDNLRGIGEVNFFFKKDGVSSWGVDADVAYLFRLANGKLTLYPVGGLNVVGWSAGGSSNSKFGVTLGGGVEVPVARNCNLKVEYNYKTQYDGISTLKFGVVIPF